MIGEKGKIDRKNKNKQKNLNQSHRKNIMFESSHFQGKGKRKKKN